MNEKVVNWMVHFEKWRFIQILNWTMLILFPVTLIGGIAWVINMAILNPNGYLGAMMQVNRWFPQLWFVRAAFGDISRATTRVLALYAALISAYVTTRIYRRPNLLAEVSSVASYILIFVHTVRNNRAVIDTSYYSGYWFIVGILVGYATGMIFVKFGKKEITSKIDVLENSKPFLITIAAAFILHIIYAIFRTFSLDTAIAENVSYFFNQHSSFGLTILITIISTFSLWFGYAGTINFSNAIFGNEAAINLNYILNHKAAPYPFTPNSLYNGFGQFGGAGVTLALIIAILIIGKNQRAWKVTKWSVFPVFFNVNMPLLVGLPIILNPIYLIPIVIAPIINIVIAGLATIMGLIPAIVYPVATGTPGILIPFIGSGGNWIMLVFSLILLILDVIIFVPFVKLASQVSEAINNEK